MKPNDTISADIVKVVSAKISPAHEVVLGGGRVIKIPQKTHYVVTVRDTHIDGDFVEVHSEADYNKINWLEFELNKTNQTLAHLKELTRNYIKYDMPASKEIMKGRLIRQFGITELEDDI